MAPLLALTDSIGIKFKNTKLLEQAFVHRSYLNEVKQNLSSNERLEFLGDSILSFIISIFLFERRPSDAEGDLTNLRSYIVKTKSLAEAAQNLKLGEYLLMSKGEEMSGGRTNPQLLANTFESFLGAIFLDQGLIAAQKLVDSTLLQLLKQEIKKGPPKDAKSQLQETVQENTKQSPKYKILQTSGPDHAKLFTVGVFIQGKETGKGTGLSKQIAEEQAAQQALEKLSS